MIEGWGMIVIIKATKGDLVLVVKILKFTKFMRIFMLLKYCQIKGKLPLNRISRGRWILLIKNNIRGIELVFLIVEWKGMTKFLVLDLSETVKGA